MAISKLVFSFPVFLTVTVPHACSNRTALAALLGPHKNMSAGNTPVTWYKKVQYTAFLLAIAVNESWKGRIGVWFFPKYCHLSKRLSSSLDSAQYGYGPRQCGTNGIRCPYWGYTATQTKPAYHEGCKVTEDMYSSVETSEWIFPLKQFVNLLQFLSMCVWRNWSGALSTPKIWGTMTFPYSYFISLFGGKGKQLWTIGSHGSSCFHKILELSAQNSIKPTQQQSRVQYVILNSS